MSTRPYGEDRGVRARGICELVLEASDVAALGRFYQRLGLQVLAREADRMWLAVGDGSRLGIWSRGKKEHGDRGGRHVHFALSTSRAALIRTARVLREEGVEVEGPVVHPGGDRSIYVDDPDENRVELWDYFEDGDGECEGVDGLGGDGR